MKNVRQEIWIWVQVLTFVAVWVFVLKITNTELKINVEALRTLPEVVFFYAILYQIFKKWGWRLPFLQGWLVPFPDLQGTWQGTLQTTWKDPNTGQTPSPISMILVIRQSFESISCVLYTKESPSYSNTASLTEDDSSGIKKISYIYTSKPNVMVRDKNAMHDGAAILNIVSKPKKSLEGEYWTSRETTGSMSLYFQSKELAENFVWVERKDEVVENAKLQTRPGE